MEKKNTRLFHGVPAIFDDGQWIVLSADFKEIITIPENEIDDPKIFHDLRESGFFEYETSPVTTFQLTLITTSDCNLRCAYCFANSGEFSALMTEDIARAAVEHAVKASAGRKLSVAFFGGEPTLTSGLIQDVVEYATTLKKAQAENNEVEFSITTNGVMSAEFLEFLISKKFKVTLSADGPAEIQNIHRPLKNGGESSNIVEKTIRQLAPIIKEFKLRVTATSFSVSRMDEIVDWFHSLGGKLIHFEPVSISGRATKNNKGLALEKPSPEEFSDNLQKAILRGNELGVQIVNSAFMNISTPPPEFCEGNANNRISVSYTGDVTTCVEVQEKCHPASTDFIIGKYDSNTKSIVLDREERKKLCDGIKIKDCLECFAVRSCGGGCPVRNFHTTGSMGKVDPYRCENIKSMLPFLIKMFLKTSMEAAKS
jgi:uncharacterized protein